MLREFLAVLPNLDDAIRQACREKNYELLFETVHKMAGLASGSGAPKIQNSAMYLKAILKRDPKPYEEINTTVASLLQSTREFNDKFSGAATDN
ncbi:MAG: Hpt domain-containing protein [Candidatus Thiodiazotropha sp.]